MKQITSLRKLVQNSKTKKTCIQTEPNLSTLSGRKSPTQCWVHGPIPSYRRNTCFSNWFKKMKIVGLALSIKLTKKSLK